MTDCVHLNSCSSEEFCQVLKKLSGIASIHVRIHGLLCDMQNNLSNNVKKILYIYFSLLEDGNTRIALDPQKALNKWIVKWRNLIKLADCSELKIIDIDSAESEFEHLIRVGIEDILTHNYSNIIENRESSKATEPHGLSRPFVCASDTRDSVKYLYATRYFDAKCVIEDKTKDIFSFDASSITDEQREDCQAYFKPLLKEAKESNKPFELAERQLDAVIRGQRENLIITGGPGTGKTTVICFLLWKLLAENKKMLHWEIKLAAPSGKAADRMRESLLGSLSKFKDEQSEIYKKLQNLESYTLHRLLSYNPRKNAFNFNAENRFPENWLFVIDEASMIDIDLFAKFMQALPENNYKLFILGDPDQLPSVEAGAVLGEMLETESISVRLNESKRFDSSSEIGRLSLAIQDAKTLKRWPEQYPKPVFQENSDIDYSNIINNKDYKDIIHYIFLGDDKKIVETRLKKLIQKWVDAFYIQTKYIDLCKQIYVDASGEFIDSQTCLKCTRKMLDKLWNMTKSARILSAERRGVTGIVQLNEMIRSMLKIEETGKFYIGQLLMLTENQSELKLYNGDCGIVLGESNSKRLHLLLKKVRTNIKNNTNEGDAENNDAADYVTYPLSLLPTDALESAFAMTIHKSQGSGYENIMMFLPQTVGHPLLNNQMIYTGVTRTEHISLTIAASQNAFEAGCTTISERDTGICIKAD